MIRRANSAEAQLADLETKINNANEDLAQQYDELAGLTSAAEISDAEGRIDALQRVLTTYQSSYASLLQAMMSEQSPNNPHRAVSRPWPPRNRCLSGASSPWASPGWLGWCWP